MPVTLAKVASGLLRQAANGRQRNQVGIIMQAKLSRLILVFDMHMQDARAIYQGVLQVSHTGITGVFYLGQQ